MARRTNVPAATLRKWEERYGVPAPMRTEGAQRRYGDRELRQIEWLRDRLAEGLRIGQAVALLRRVDEPLGGALAIREAIFIALADRLPSRIEALVNQAFTVLDPEAAIAEVAAPVLQRTGELWEQDKITIAEEHFVSQLLATKLRAILDTTASGSAGVAALACLPGERHEIGLLALAALLQTDGWRVLYLGQDTPLPQAFELAAAADARVLALSGTMGGPTKEAVQDLARLEKQYPGLRVVRGGSGFGGPSAQQAVRSRRKLRRRAASERRGAALAAPQKRTRES